MTRISKLLVSEGNIHSIKTNKYKDITVSFKCAFPYSRKFKAALSLLSQMLHEQCEKYPTKDLMSKAKDLLYGLSFDCSIINISDLIIFSITYSFTNPSFFDDVNENNYIAFIDETLKRPLLTQNILDETKRRAKDTIQRILDKPNVFAADEFNKIVSKDDEHFEIESNLFKDEIDNVSLDDLKGAYNNLFNSRTDIYLVGDYKDELFNYLKQFKSKIDLTCTSRPLNLIPKDDITIKKEVGQSTLIVSYKVPYVRADKEFYAYNVGNILFGGIPTSLLFSEIREKDNLCYIIYSRVFRHAGLSTIVTLIDKDNKDKVVSSIRKQYQRIVDKDYDPSLLDIAKTMLISNSLSIDDDMDYLISYHYEGIISNTYIPMDENLKKISEVSADDISNVFKKYEDYFVFFLEGVKSE